VDHSIPKSMRWDRVYEWNNYRLAAALMSSRKGRLGTVLDPFEIEDDWFELELDGYQVIPKPGIDPKLAEKIQDTIDVLELNDKECVEARREYIDGYWTEEVSLRHIEKKAPFVARELRRQERLLEGDC
jgi:hypothetical protein